MHHHPVDADTEVAQELGVDPEIERPPEGGLGAGHQPVVELVEREAPGLEQVPVVVGDRLGRALGRGALPEQQLGQRPLRVAHLPLELGDAGEGGGRQDAAVVEDDRFDRCHGPGEASPEGK